MFECFHNFVAFSQWGNTLYNVMLKLEQSSDDPDVRASFRKTMEGSFDQAAAARPSRRSNASSWSCSAPSRPTAAASPPWRRREPRPSPRHGYIVTPHTATSLDPRHWEHPERFDPTRYSGVPTSNDIDEARAKQLGFARCPFEGTRFEVKDGRKATLDNSAFGTVYGVADGKPMPVCDYAGFAPFGFGYRRCPGEQLTINVFEDFLRKVWKERIEFVKLNIANPEPVPIGPTTVIGDNVGFVRSA